MCIYLNCFFKKRVSKRTVNGIIASLVIYKTNIQDHKLEMKI